MKCFITILCTAALLVAGVATAASTPAPAPGHAEQTETQPYGRDDLSVYRVLSSKRHHRVVQPGLVHQTGSLSLAVGNRPLRTITYSSEQNFVPGGGHSVLRLADVKTRGTARFTISQDGARSTFSFGNGKEHTLEANPDDTFTYDGVGYSSSLALATAMIEAKHVSEDSLELLAGAVEIGSSELRAVDKRTKKARAIIGKIIKVIVVIITTIGGALNK